MPPILALQRICKRFGAVVVAQEIDLALAEGEALGIIGLNGAGKSTLFGIASGSVRPDSGAVMLAGLGIPMVADSMADELAQAFGNADDLMNATEERLSRVEGIGPERARRIHEYFQSPAGRQLIAELGCFTDD